jgi:hypothetical protein
MLRARMGLAQTAIIPAALDGCMTQHPFHRFRQSVINCPCAIGVTAPPTLTSMTV